MAEKRLLRPWSSPCVRRSSAGRTCARSAAGRPRIAGTTPVRCCAPPTPKQPRFAQSRDRARCGSGTPMRRRSSERSNRIFRGQRWSRPRVMPSSSCWGRPPAAARGVITVARPSSTACSSPRARWWSCRSWRPAWTADPERGLPALETLRASTDPDIRWIEKRLSYVLAADGSPDGPTSVNRAEVLVSDLGDLRP